MVKAHKSSRPGFKPQDHQFICCVTQARLLNLSVSQYPSLELVVERK